MMWMVDWALHNIDVVLLWAVAAVLWVAIFRGYRKLRAERRELAALRRGLYVGPGSELHRTRADEPAWWQRPWAGETELLYALAATFDCEYRGHRGYDCRDGLLEDLVWCRSCTARAACKEEDTLTYETASTVEEIAAIVTGEDRVIGMVGMTVEEIATRAVLEEDPPSPRDVLCLVCGARVTERHVELAHRYNEEL